jgi:hypothetical protein
MKGDAWKRREDQWFIRYVSNFLRNLQIQCQRFDCKCHMRSTKFHMTDYPPMYIEEVRVFKGGFGFFFNHREFMTCPGCGEILERSTELPSPAGNFYGVCWRCNPEEYAREE